MALSYESKAIYAGAQEMKLKTLKDLQIIDIDKEKEILKDINDSLEGMPLEKLTSFEKNKITPREFKVNVEELKAEAVKWVKKINKDGGMCHTCDELWINFFNLTEEDLK